VTLCGGRRPLLCCRKHGCAAALGWVYCWAYAQGVVLGHCLLPLLLLVGPGSRGQGLLLPLLALESSWQRLVLVMTCLWSLPLVLKWGNCCPAALQRMGLAELRRA
jgi:hypothetical protein